MIIGTIQAKQAYESRVAITPDSVKKLIKLGHEVIIGSRAVRSTVSGQYYLCGTKPNRRSNLSAVCRQHRHWHARPLP